MMLLDYFLFILPLTGAVGYALFTAVFYHQKFSPEKKIAPCCAQILMSAALVLPMLLAAILFFCYAGTISPIDKGMLFCSGLFPWIAVAVMLIVFPVVKMIQRKFLKKLDPAAKTPDSKEELVVPAVAGGCAIPFLLFVFAFIVLGNMGMHMSHDYRPGLDGPQPIVQWNGVDFVSFFDSLAGLAFFSVLLFFVITGFVVIIQRGFVQEFRKFKLVELIIVIVIICGLVALLWPAVKAAREVPRRRPSCNNMLKTIALAMNGYQDQYGSLPPAYTVDAEGRPLHSWRVLLLPFLGKEQLYNEIRLDEPWDSEYNRRFHDVSYPYFTYRCPEANRARMFWVSEYYPDLPPGENCDYSVVVGPDTLFPGSDCRSLDDFSAEQLEKTPLVVERRKPICWMDPTHEISEETFRKGINIVEDGAGSQTHHGANIVYADGQTAFLKEKD